MSKLAFLFPGQGAQAVGMGRQAYEKSSSVRDLFARAGKVLGYDLAHVCFEGPTEKLDSTRYSQPALFVCGLAGLELLRSEAPDTVSTCAGTAGLSLGEYTAMVFADAISFEDGLRVVDERAAAMQAASDAAPSGMVSILGLDLERIQAMCDEVRQEGEILQVANHLCPGNIVVSGAKGACQRIAESAVGAGAMKAVPLSVAGAFHTPYMQPAIARLERAIGEIDISPPRIPVVSNVDARPHSDPAAIRQLLVAQVVSPVQWEGSMRYLLDQGFDAFYEVGPGRVLRGLLKRVNRKVPCESVTV